MWAAACAWVEGRGATQRGERRSLRGSPRLPASHCTMRACMLLELLALVFAGSLSALRTCVAQMSAYLR